MPIILKGIVIVLFAGSRSGENFMLKNDSGNENAQRWVKLHDMQVQSLTTFTEY